jgi:hypothetical protein
MHHHHPQAAKGETAISSRRMFCIGAKMAFQNKGRKSPISLFETRNGFPLTVQSIKKIFDLRRISFRSMYVERQSMIEQESSLALSLLRTPSSRTRRTRPESRSSPTEQYARGQIKATPLAGRAPDCTAAAQRGFLWVKSSGIKPRLLRRSSSNKNKQSATRRLLLRATYYVKVKIISWCRLPNNAKAAN